VTAWRVLNGVFALAFTLSALLQYNDADWMRWVAVYVAALGACFAWDVGWAVRANAAVIGAVALGWAVVIARGMTLLVPLSVAITDWGMHTQGSEDVREIGGLLIVTAWMAVIAFVLPERYVVRKD
jgi:hypothetical protein